MAGLLAIVAAALASCGGSPPPTPDQTMTADSDNPAGSAGPAVGQLPAVCVATDPSEPVDDTPVDTGPVYEARAFGPGQRNESRVIASDDMCEVADNNIEDTIGEILTSDVPAARATSTPWNKRANPEHYGHVVQRLGLSKKELSLLRANGFVVSRFDSYPSYAYAYHEIYRSQLPIYVTVDSILNAIYVGHDVLLTSVEQSSIAPATREAAHKMHCELAVRAPSYPTELARDLDLYLSVALSLLDGQMVASKLGDAGVDAEAAALVSSALAGDELAQVTLFGRDRMIDFTQFTPRGHYADPKNGLEAYFRGAMWLSRLELNLVSRSSQSSAPAIDASETPREVRMALALAELAGGASVMDDIASLDAAWALFAGAREDVSLHQIAALAERAGIASASAAGAAEALIEAIGSDFQRTQRLHFTPEGATTLPAIATLLGPRIVGDTGALLHLVSDEVPERYELGAADIAYALGHDRSTAYLADDLKRFPTLAARLTDARADIAAVDTKAGDLYSAWLIAIRQVAAAPIGALPSFMETTAYDDLQLNTAIAGYGQLRHNHVLLAGQGYDAYGCEIPSGYVEPKPAVYAALARYAALGEAAMAALGDDEAVGYFARVGQIMRVLERISEHQLTGQPLTDAQQRFLSMVAEMREGSSGGPPAFTGWYFDLFQNRSADGTKQADFIADYYTSTNAGTISYIGAGAPHLGAFVVDVGGGPRLVVGPVARAYQYTGSLSTRLDDDASMKLPDAVRVAPWAASYSLPNGPEPDMAIELEQTWDEDSGRQHLVAKVTAKSKVGKVTIEILDHHREVERSKSVFIGAGVTKFRMPDPPVRPKAKAKPTGKKTTVADADDDEGYDDEDYDDDGDGWSPYTLVLVRAGDYAGLHQLGFDMGLEEMGIYLGSMERPDPYADDE